MKQSPYISVTILLQSMQLPAVGRSD